jgi:GNAT superfamily N-acetyltransferase
MKGPNLTFRAATVEDVPAVVRLLADDVIGANRERIEDPLPAAYYDAFRAIEADPHNELIVAELGPAIVGTVQVTYTPNLSRKGLWRATLEALRVDSSTRGAGIGAALVREVIDRARQRGCGIVQLTTDRRRVDAQRFYEGLGFTHSHIGMKLSVIPEAGAAESLS